MKLGRSPILLPPQIGNDAHRVAAVADVETAVIEVAVSGCWNRQLQLACAGVLRGCVAARPAGILLNLQDLHDPDGASAALWRTVRGWTTPACPVVAHAPLEPRLAGVRERCEQGGNLRIYETLPQARAALDRGGPGTDRLRLSLVADPAAAAQARELVTDACTRWQRTELGLRARILISELVVNAVEHACAGIEATITRLPTGLHLGVYDDDPRLPQMRPAGSEPGDVTARGLGLRAVHHAASMWGALPTRTGKMVWAIT
ncbi:ATP-binding protein [Couchioplanes azureus]|uniref:ATP-binding protein n=1 Tax=Couchioplanes caeruleus TaxID=56438 RepID=UPI0016711804|nr:ATP-binding protein [Couchioplanes caeruleus]GGQ42863.1 hypothetical protein GCM10010166_08830 [Couchioplanes caeruleus subsp. azureus]